MSENSRIIYIFDGDGSLIHGVPIGTMKKILMGQSLFFSNEMDDIREQNRSLGLVGQALVWAKTQWLDSMTVKPEMVEYIPKFRKLAESKGLEPVFAFSSGRDESRRNMTEEALQKAQLLPFFQGRIYLNNNGKDTATAKAERLIEMAKEADLMVCFEDDVQSAIEMAKASKNLKDKLIVIYLFRNPLYRTWLLKRTGIGKLPLSIVPTKNVRTAFTDLGNNLMIAQPLAV